jgi:hypothetical protein
LSLPPQYLDVAGFKRLSRMPSSDVDTLESLEPGYLDEQLQLAQAEVDSRLRKRYTVPFAAPYPKKALGWIAAIVTFEAYNKRGRNPQDPAVADLTEARDRALTEIKEAADSKDGLYDLPLREDAQTSGISAGGPLGTSQVSPYDWVDVDAEAMS